MLLLCSKKRSIETYQHVCDLNAYIVRTVNVTDPSLVTHILGYAIRLQIYIFHLRMRPLFKSI